MTKTKIDDRLRVYLTLPSDMRDMFDRVERVTGLKETDFVKLVFTSYYEKVFNDLVKTAEDIKISLLTK